MDDAKYQAHLLRLSNEKTPAPSSALAAEPVPEPELTQHVAAKLTVPPYSDHRAALTDEGRQLFDGTRTIAA